MKGKLPHLYLHYRPFTKLGSYSFPLYVFVSMRVYLHLNGRYDYKHGKEHGNSSGGLIRDIHPLEFTVPRNKR